MAKSPQRYTTFAPGELEARLRELSPNGEFFCVTESDTQAAHRTGSRLLKEHCFRVSLPDGTEALCRYERLASQYHRFEYLYEDGATLPRQNFFERLANDVKTIEAKGREFAEPCFREAIAWERRNYFARASEPSDGSRKARPGQYRLKGKVAKELAGHYCVCQVFGTFLLPVSAAYGSLEQANAVWKERAMPKTVVACCNRLDRCFEVPKYNPLYANAELREVAQQIAPERLGRKKVMEDEPLSEAES